MIHDRRTDGCRCDHCRARREGRQPAAGSPAEVIRSTLRKILAGEDVRRREIVAALEALDDLE